jgi:hypothetical protein
MEAGALGMARRTKSLDTRALRHKVISCAGNIFGREIFSCDLAEIIIHVLRSNVPRFAVIIQILK